MLACGEGGNCVSAPRMTAAVHWNDRRDLWNYEDPIHLDAAISLVRLCVTPSQMFFLWPQVIPLRGDKKNRTRRHTRAAG
jgi:hypothetical protein